MGNLFSVEGRFYSITSRILDMAAVTFMWIIGCIPLVTVLTSTASLYHVTVKCIRYDRGKAWQEFIQAYKKNLGQGTALALLYGGVGAALAYGDYRIVRMQEKTGAGFMLAFGLFLLTVLYLMNVLWIIPVFSRFANTVGKIVQLSFVISVRYMLRGIPMFVIFMAAAAGILASPPLAVILPALAMLLISYLSEPALHRYMPKQETDNGDWRYGFR